MRFTTLGVSVGNRAVFFELVDTKMGNEEGYDTSVGRKIENQKTCRFCAWRGLAVVAHP